jgi:NADPH-dependent 2,4-dienoyl-CoA reductase/sulfur reductase-like enzyme
VRPETALTADAGATLGCKGAIAVDVMMRTGLPDIYAAGDEPEVSAAIEDVFDGEGSGILTAADVVSVRRDAPARSAR